MKPLPPTLRDRRRYVAFEIASSKVFSKKQVEKEINNVIFKALGLFGFSNSGFWLVKYYEKQKAGIIRVNNDYLNLVLFALGFFEKIENEKIVVKIIRVTGTVKKADSFIKK